MQIHSECLDHEHAAVSEMPETNEKVFKPLQPLPSICFVDEEDHQPEDCSEDKTSLPQAAVDFDPQSLTAGKVQINKSKWVDPKFVLFRVDDDGESDEEPPAHDIAEKQSIENEVQLDPPAVEKEASLHSASGDETILRASDQRMLAKQKKEEAVKTGEEKPKRRAKKTSPKNKSNKSKKSEKSKKNEKSEKSKKNEKSEKSEKSKKKADEKDTASKPVRQRKPQLVSEEEKAAYTAQLAFNALKCIAGVMNIEELVFAWFSIIFSRLQLRMKKITDNYRLSMYWTRLQVGVFDKRTKKEVWASTAATPLTFANKIALANRVATKPANMYIYIYGISFTTIYLIFSRELL